MEARYCYIFGAAEFDGNLKFKPDQDRDFIIAADAGYRHLQALGIPPDMLIGDFDSLGEVPKGVELLRFPVMKDDTDLMLAVKYGFAHGYSQPIHHLRRHGRAAGFYACKLSNFIRYRQQWRKRLFDRLRFHDYRCAGRFPAVRCILPRENFHFLQRGTVL